MRHGTRTSSRTQPGVPGVKRSKPCDGAAQAQFRQTIGGLASPDSKRLLDVLLSGSLLLLLLPLMAVVALVVKMESRGPVLYRCARLGLRFRRFEMLKFRKMAEGADGPPLTAADDPRFTRCGRWLAATKLDELPQLWNVLKGDMSLVGPRPEDPQFVAMHEAEYEAILAVRPGITGLSQLAFAREAAILDSQNRVAAYVDRLLPAKVRIDLLYVQRRSLAMEIRILAWTAFAVLLRLDVAVHRESGRLGLRRPGHASRTLADRRASQPAIMAIRK